MVFLSPNVLQSVHTFTDSVGFDCMLGKKKYDLRRLSILLMSGWLPLCANLMAYFWRFSGSIIPSDFKRMLFPVMVISSGIGPKFCRSFDAVLGIHVFQDLIIPISLHSTGSSAVQFAIDDIHIWSITSIVCSVHGKLHNPSTSICSFSGNV